MEQTLANGVVLRAATLADVPALHTLETQLFPVDAWSVDLFLDEVQHPTRSYYVLERTTNPAATEIIGYCGTMIVGENADVQTIAVLPEHEGNGYGRAMLNTMHSTARTAGAQRMLLEVRADNPRAQRLYQRNGYRHIHVRRRYYEDGTDALIMVKELAPSPHPAPKDTPA